jgi:hypothetical protein
LKLFYDSYSLVLHFCALLLLSFFLDLGSLFFLFQKSVRIRHLPRGKLEKKIAPKAIQKTAPHRAVTVPCRAAPPPHVRKHFFFFMCAAIFAVPCRPAPREKTSSRETCDSLAEGVISLFYNSSELDTDALWD